ncbi:general stress protein [Spirosoma litoris]
MENQQATVAVYNDHQQAEEAINELQKAGYDMKKLSIVGQDYHTEENVIGYYTTGDRMKTWGSIGAFWGGLWGLLFGSAFFIIPGFGPLLIAGPFVASLVASLEGAIALGGLSAVGAALVGLGIPKNSVLTYEASIKAGKFVLIAHGTPDEVERAKHVLGLKKQEVVENLG